MSGTVKLSQIIKYVDDGCKRMKHREKRLSRELGSEQWTTEKLLENHLKSTRGILTDETVIALDISDITKDNGRRFEYLSPVLDGSSGVIRNGYWFVTISAIHRKGKQTPLYVMPYSSRAPGFESQNLEIQRAVEKVISSVGTKGLWVMDGGFDSLLIFQYFSSVGLRFLIRVYEPRLIKGEGKLTELAETMDLPYQQETVVKRLYGQRRKKERITVHYGYRAIQLPEQWNPYTRRRESILLTLLVVEGIAGEGKRTYFVTSEQVSTPQEALHLLRQYVQRWGCEDAIRFLKQEFHIEDIRVLKFRRIQRLVLLALMVFAFLSELELYCQRRAQWVMEKLSQWSMELDTDATFLYYRLHKAAVLTLTLNYVVTHFR